MTDTTLEELQVKADEDAKDTLLLCLLNTVPTITVDDLRTVLCRPSLTGNSSIVMFRLGLPEYPIEWIGAMG
jgi:hypothetical protein